MTRDHLFGIAVIIFILIGLILGHFWPDAWMIDVNP